MNNLKQFFFDVEMKEVLLGLLTIPLSLSFFMMVCILCAKLVVSFYELIF